MSKPKEPSEVTSSEDLESSESSRPRKGWCNHQVKLNIKGCKLKARRKVIIKFTVIIVAFLGVLGTLYALMKTGIFQNVLEWIRGLGAWGNVMLGTLLIVGAMPFTTGWSLVAMACGLLYGMGYGVLTCAIATFLGTFMCFFVSRLLLKRCLRRKIDRGKRTRVLFHAVDKHAVKFLILIRFTPLPLGMATSIVALTRIPFYLFFPVSFTVQMVHISVYTFMGTGITSITDLINGKNTPPAQIGILVGGIALLLIMFVLGIFIGRRALNSASKEMKEDEAAKQAKKSRPSGDSVTEETASIEIPRKDASGEENESSDEEIEPDVSSASESEGAESSDEDEDSS